MKTYIKLISISIVIFFAFISVSQAQRKAPGYMGKRIVLKYDQGISWTLGTYVRATPNLFHTLQMDAAVTTKFSVGAEYSFMTRKYDKYVGRPDADYYSSGYYPYYIMNRSYMHSVGVYTKMFSQSNGHIAPAGPYFLLGINFYLIHGKFSRYNNDNFTGKPKPASTLAFDFGPSIGGGKQYIVANRMVISLDVRFTLPLVGIARTLNNEVGIDKKGDESDLKLATLEKNRWVSWPNVQSNFIVIRLGVGTLL